VTSNINNELKASARHWNFLLKLSWVFNFFILFSLWLNSFFSIPLHLFSFLFINLRITLSQNLLILSLSLSLYLIDFVAIISTKFIVLKPLKSFTGNNNRTSLSNLSSNIYSTLPKSLTSRELLVRSRFEDPEVQRKRKEIVHSKSVSELSRIRSLSEFPLPTSVEKLIVVVARKSKETR